MGGLAGAALGGLATGTLAGALPGAVVGVLIEVPVMLSIVAIVNRTKPWYERGRAVRRSQPAGP